MVERIPIRAIDPSEGAPGQVPVVSTDGLIVEWSDAAGGGGAPSASAVTVTPTGGIAATNVQAALAELDAEKATLGHTHSPQAVAAADVSYAGSSGISATNVESALDELDTEKVAIGSGSTINKIIGPISQATYDALSPKDSTALYVIVG